MIFVDANSADNGIVFANESFVDLMGDDRENILGKSLWSVLDTDEGGRTRSEMLRDFSSGGVTARRCVRGNQETFLAAVVASPVTNEKGALQQYFLSFVDLSALADDRLAEQARTHELYRFTPGFIAMTDGPDHRFLFVNRSYETLVGRRRLVGMRVIDALPEVAEQGFIDLLDEVFATGRRYSSGRVCLRLVRTPGMPPESRYVEFVYQPIRNEAREITGVFCEGWDVTEGQTTAAELLLLEGKLIHLARLTGMGTMAATLAHELNQPLAAIANYVAGCSNILATADWRSPDLQQGLNAIALAAERGSAIVRRSQLMASKNKTPEDCFDLAVALRNAVDLVEADSCRGVVIVTEIEAGGSMRGDQVQIEQVMVNLIKNGCEATRDAGNSLVVASLLCESESVGLRVCDQGHGVHLDRQECLFEWSESSKPNGMGIGLSIARTIIEAHGGTVALESTSDSGSSFTFQVPKA